MAMNFQCRCGASSHSEHAARISNGYPAHSYDRFAVRVAVPQKKKAS